MIAARQHREGNVELHYRLGLALAAVLLGPSLSAAESLTDGPYVFHSAGRSEARWVCAGVAETRVIPSNGRVEPACGEVPALVLEIAPKLAPDQVPQPRRWAAVSDIHGQTPLFLRLLAAHGIVDAERRWAWGTGVLVITGDVLDRGPNQVEALWAIYRLVQEARAVGGRVELLLGNHEVMVMAGDLRYLHPKYLDVAGLLGRSYDQLFAAESELGAWLRRRATVLKMGDTLFLHGGLHPSFAKAAIDVPAVNTAFRARLGRSSETPGSDPEGEFLLGADGPIWYRGYFEPAQATSAEIDALLAAAKVKRIVVGHTTMNEITPLYQGRVIGIDAALKTGTRGELLIFDQRQLWRGLLDGQRLPLPAG